MRILITGASSGIGAALAREWATRGAHVWLAARRADRLQEQVSAIAAAGGVAHAVTLDVQRLDELERLIGELDDEVGGFDVVVANAGIGGKGTTASGTSFADARPVFDVNLLGAVATLLAAQKPMLERKRGRLVAVSSLAGLVPLPVALDYGAAKAGLSYFVRAMRHELLGRGITVTLVEPGFVKSEMTDQNDFPMPFMMPSEKAARVIVGRVERGAALVRLPAFYRWLFVVVRLLPLWLVSRVALATTKPPAANRGTEGEGAS